MHNVPADASIIPHCLRKLRWRISTTKGSLDSLQGIQKLWMIDDGLQIPEQRPPIDFTFRSLGNVGRCPCSVSSLKKPRPIKKRCWSGALPKRRAARRGDNPSRGKPRASPTAIPKSTPSMRSKLGSCSSMRIRYRNRHANGNIAEFSRFGLCDLLDGLPARQRFFRSGTFWQQANRR